MAKHSQSLSGRRDAWRDTRGAIYGTPRKSAHATLVAGRRTITLDELERYHRRRSRWMRLHGRQPPLRRLFRMPLLNDVGKCPMALDLLWARRAGTNVSGKPSKQRHAIRLKAFPADRL
jgi:hypothetical protein